ncbi:TetR/AcrR family transcriptional regulator [Nocardia rhizosphaerihabitans]|uniref:HTH tetR-type domain-containing protein n=1 Tax=Nocardia rhizosphaerihabitans TaxID=1691570 RepID=A0ABQ2L360_9NOCA|nr:TetR/AcrR family transcriptional regulator [Nocardia rhizosphaerihabitans]GGO00646.1 hypothetical protein GCM10011610_69800 [Nocardia rhizosphaerihabitans]
MSAHKRREQALSVALPIFAEKGYVATGTYEIAEKVGISQPYVIRLFGRKRDLFLAVLYYAWDRLEGSLLHSTDYHARDEHEHSRDLPPTALDAVLSEPAVLHMLLQGFAASSDPVIREAVRDRFGRFYMLARSMVDMKEIEVAHHFLADVMLLTTTAALRLTGPDAVPAPWSRELVDDLRIMPE